MSSAEKVYQRLQRKNQTETPTTQEAVMGLAENWKDESLPSLQREVADLQMQALRQGIPVPVFSTFIKTLKRVPSSSFSLLDAACASGYYAEVVRTLDDREIAYTGSDYSEAMVAYAKKYYPKEKFERQDLTRLGYADKQFDVVLASGVLEHVPDYKKALKEMTRVAKSYVLVHRCPLFFKSEAHVFMLASQYDVDTLRTYFSESLLLREISELGFKLVYSTDVTPLPWTVRVRAFFGRAGGSRQKSLLFKRG